MTALRREITLCEQPAAHEVTDVCSAMWTIISDPSEYKEYFKGPVPPELGWYLKQWDKMYMLDEFSNRRHRPSKIDLLSAHGVRV